MNNKKAIPRKKKIPYYRKPAELSIDEWQAGLRRQFAAEQDFEIQNIGKHPVFSDFSVFNPESGNTYKVSIRDNEHSHNFCSCPDFRTNGLGTCKHIENVILTLKKTKTNWTYFNHTQPQSYSSLSIFYGKERRLRLKPGRENGNQIQQLFQPIIDKEGFIYPEKLDEIEEYLKRASSIDPDFRVYPDAYEYIQGYKKQLERQRLADNLFPKGIKSDIFDDLISTTLYPYQKKAVIKAFKAGRVLIADEMGLGKTIQALATVELFARYLDVKRVLIICPTSLKYQWQKEIEKFTDKSSQVVEGLIHKRKTLYKQKEFYKIISYGITRNDLDMINAMSPDLVILDEAQRIKNWKTKTAKAVKQIQSKYTIVLTGTPLENRLQELHSIVEFIDMYRLGPLFRFLHNHESTDEFGKVIGYKRLKSINKTLEPVLIRRTKKEIIDQLPGRIDKNLFVDMTKEQRRDHNSYYELVCRLVNKWRRQGFLLEEDRKNLLINLSCMRMVADSTFILNKNERNDTKIDELMCLLEEILETPENKVVIFSEWKKMFELLIQELEKRDIEYVYLHGSLSTKARKHIINRFHKEPDLKIFLSTDAGGLGLNLQCANIAINLDLPWNPARLEQRIARIYRLGQNQHAYIYNFISRDSIEHRIYYLLGFKKSLFSGALDGEKDTVKLDDNHLGSFMETVETLTQQDTTDTKPAGKKKKKSTISGDKFKDNFKVKPHSNTQRYTTPSQAKKTSPQTTPRQTKNVFKRIGKFMKRFLERFNK